MSAPLYSHLVLDFDGTLVDSLRTKVRNAAELFAQRFGAAPDRVAARYYFHSGVARRVLFERIAIDVIGHGLAESEYAALDAAFTERNLATVGSAPPQPRVPEVLAELGRRGARMAVSSSAPEHDLAPRVARSGLGAFFDVVLASRDGFRKGPGHVAHLQALWKADRTTFLSVGDEVADADLAGEAGIACALVTHTLTAAEAAAARPTHVLPTFEHLLALAGPASSRG